MILGPKLINMRLIPSKDFFLENTMILGQNLIFVGESQTIFCPIRKELQNPDLGKCQKIWATSLPPNFFLPCTPMISCKAIIIFIL